jgi:putative copper export protein
MAFTATIPLLGHASGDAARMALHSLHIFAAGAWLGTLAVVLLIRLPPLTVVSNEPRATRQRLRLLILRRFAPIALSAAAMAVAAGIVAAWLYLGALANLWTAAYGRVLLLKIVLVGAVSACGYTNWRRLRSSPRDDGSMSIIMLELTLAIAVVIVTGVLTEVSHP